MKMSVVIPAHNEEENVGNMVKMLFDNFGPLILEVIIVDDCSTDGTGQILERLKKRYSRLVPVHRTGIGGVGFAIRTGLEKVSGKATHVLMLDCDFTKNLQDIKRVVDSIDGFDGILGSRYMKGGVLKNYSLPKKIGNRAFHTLAKVFLGLKQADVTNNFRFYRREVIGCIAPKLVSTGFSINAEIGLYPIMLGYNIHEVPVSWIERTRGMGISDFKVFKVAPGYVKVLGRAIKFKYFSRRE